MTVFTLLAHSLFMANITTIPLVMVQLDADGRVFLPRTAFVLKERGDMVKAGFFLETCSLRVFFRCSRCIFMHIQINLEYCWTDDNKREKFFNLKNWDQEICIFVLINKLNYLWVISISGVQAVLKHVASHHSIKAAWLQINWQKIVYEAKMRESFR